MTEKLSGNVAIWVVGALKSPLIAGSTIVLAVFVVLLLAHPGNPVTKIEITINATEAVNACRTRRRLVRDLPGITGQPSIGEPLMSERLIRNTPVTRFASS